MAAADESARVLPAPVPPHPGERRVVGAGLHGVDERRPGGAPLPRALPAPRPGRPGLLRPAPPREQAGPGRPGARVRRARLLLLPLLVRGPAPAGAAVRRGAVVGAAGLPVLPLLGERELDAE